MSMISLKTWQHVARRFCSRVWSAAKAGHASKVATMRALGFFMAGLLCLILLAPSVGDNWPGGRGCPIRDVNYLQIFRQNEAPRGRALCGRRTGPWLLDGLVPLCGH